MNERERTRRFIELIDEPPFVEWNQAQADEYADLGRVRCPSGSMDSTLQLNHPTLLMQGVKLTPGASQYIEDSATETSFLDSEKGSLTFYFVCRCEACQRLPGNESRTDKGASFMMPEGAEPAYEYELVKGLD